MKLLKSHIFLAADCIGSGVDCSDIMKKEVESNLRGGLFVVASWTPGHREGSVNGDVATALGQIGSDAAVTELLWELFEEYVYSNDEDDWVHPEIVEALRQIGEAAIPAMLDALCYEGKDDYWLRSQAAWALANVGRSAAIPGLVNLLLNNNDEHIRRSAAEALGKIGDGAAVPGLIEALKDEKQFVRRNAIIALEKIGHVSAVKHLIGLLSDRSLAFYDSTTGSSTYICDLAARALKSIGTLEALEAVKEWPVDKC